MEFLKMLWFNYLINAVDILIVTYIFYRLLLLIKGTRSEQIIIGIITLAVIAFIAQVVLHLRTLSWLFEKFWLAGMVILAVVFQPEIRSALAQLGSHRWGKILAPSELSFISEIIEAIKELSAKRLGGLIVIEQDTGLRNYIETGIRINAHISKELLISKFNPASPLHDGAAIVQNIRLTAAGCVLPLSNRPDLSKILGTRHRSAVGLSEISDAIVIVVSEETGMVSLAREGRLETNINIDELGRMLVEVFRDRADNSFFKRMGIEKYQ